MKMFSLNSNVTRLAILAVIIVLGFGAWWAVSPKVLANASSSKSYADLTSAPTPYTKTFQTGGKWQVTYSYTCGRSVKAPTFAYVVLPDWRKSGKVVIFDKSSGSATNTYTMSGSHRLEIASDCPYSVKVREARF